MLEECSLEYKVIPIDITKGAQFEASFLAVSPNNRVPAIVDHLPSGPQSVFESGAILVYLAEKTGKFLASSGPARIEALQWLFWQMGGLGPMAGQAGHFRRYEASGENAYAIKRYTDEVGRLYGVLDRRLADRQWIAGDYSIADIACWGWIWFYPLHGQDLNAHGNLRRWFYEMSDRPAVQKAKYVGFENVSEEVRQLYQGPYYQKKDSFGADQTRVPDNKA